MTEPIPEDDPVPVPESAWSSFVRRWRTWTPRPGGSWRIPWKPVRRLLIVVAVLAAAMFAWRGTQKSFQAVPPGDVGVCVNRFTGSLALLEPGTHFRPPALYEIHPVRISDQLLSAEAGEFSVTTKEGVIARLTVQARWAIDRKQLLTKWAALPPSPAHELVAPVLSAAFRTVAPRYEVARLISEKREELATVAAVSARERLAESGVLLKEVLIGDLVLPPEYEKGRIAMVDEVQSTERLDVTLKRKAKEVEETRLTAEAQKAREVEQAEASRIQTLADVDRRKAMADAEAYATRVTAQADFERLAREAKLVSENPLLIPKTFADRLSERVQVILTPSIGGEQLTGEIFKRVANGEPPLAPPPDPPATVTASKKADGHNR
jgi:regulator of protease activity HflC (stomatin/prohibitin superfamily)